MSSYRDDPIDEEIEGLMKALNLIPGVTTQASCCGHGRDSFYVWLQCSTLESIVGIRRVFNGCIHCDGTRTHYNVEISPYRVMVDHDNQLDAEGNVILDKDGKPIFCVNLIVTSDDLQGLQTNIGFADEKTRRDEFYMLETFARNVAIELS